MSIRQLKIADSLLLFFLFIQAPICLLFDAQAVLPREWYPDVLVKAVDDYNRDFKDYLNATHPPWFSSFIIWEVALQLPLAMCMCVGIIRQKGSLVRLPGVIWGTNVLTTTVACVFDFWHSELLTNDDRIKLTAMYSPWMLVPLYVLLRMWTSPDPFGNNRDDFTYKTKEGGKKKTS